MKALAFAAALLVAAPALAQAPRKPVREVVVTRVIDGDTFGFKMPGVWPEIADFSVRIKGLDTPESSKRNAKCDREIERGTMATMFTRTMIMYYKNRVFLHNIEHDKYGGRIVADVTFNDGTDLADTIIANGHGRYYDGGTKGKLVPMNPIDRYLIEAKKKKDYENVTVPPELKARFQGVSVGKDKNGFFCYTHRARSKSKPRIEDIPKKDIAFIESTG